MSVFLKLKPGVQALICVSCTAIVILAMTNQGGVAALLAVVGGIVAIARKGGKSEE